MEIKTNAKGRKYEQRKNTAYEPPAVLVSNENRLVFEPAASLGVETDPVYFEQGDTLRLRFEFKVVSTSDKGFLTLCTLGDRTPIRVAIPANRTDSLYVYANQGWTFASKIEASSTTKIELVFTGTRFGLKVNEQEMLYFTNPVQNPTARLYLGEGFDLAFLENPMKYHPSGSLEILTESIQTKIDP